MKTILMCHQSGNLYGSDRIFLCLVKTLSSRYKLVIILDSDGPLRHELNKYTEKIYIHKLGALRKKVFLSATFLEFINACFLLNKVINIYKPDIMITNTIIILSPPIIAKIRNVPNTWFVHEHPQGQMQKTFFRFLLHLLSKNIVVPSKSVARWVGAKNKVINYIEDIGLPNENLSLKIRKTLVVKIKKPIIIGCMGMLHPKKGQLYLLKIIERLIAKYPIGKRIRAVFVGGRVAGYEGYYKRLLMEVKARNLQDFVIFKSFKKNYLDWLEAMDVVVIPSQYEEPFPLVFQEAAKLGKPIIATKTGALKELIKDNKNGIFIPMHDEIKASQTINNFLINQKRQIVISKQLRNYYKERFNLKSFQKKITRIFS